MRSKARFTAMVRCPVRRPQSNSFKLGPPPTTMQGWPFQHPSDSTSPMFSGPSFWSALHEFGRVAGWGITCAGRWLIEPRRRRWFGRGPVPMCRFRGSGRPSWRYLSAFVEVTIISTASLTLSFRVTSKLAGKERAEPSRPRGHHHSYGSAVAHLWNCNTSPIAPPYRIQPAITSELLMMSCRSPTVRSLRSAPCAFCFGRMM